MTDCAKLIDEVTGSGHINPGPILANNIAGMGELVNVINGQGGAS